MQYKYSRAGLTRAIELFHRAIELEPNYAPAYAGLTEAHINGSGFGLPTQEAMLKSKAAALKALSIDESLSEPLAPLAIVKFYGDWDWAGSELCDSRALPDLRRLKRRR